MQKFQICKEGTQTITSKFGYRIKPKWKVEFLKKFKEFTEFNAKLDVKNEASRKVFFAKVQALIPGIKYEEIFQYHSGVDLVTSAKNKDLIAPFDGVITQVFEDGLNGKYFKISCLVEGIGWIFSACHCENVLVKISDKVKKGDVIATMGQTGNTVTGVHVHVTVRRKATVVDPQSYFTF
jgi:murein DD-endopeptidase MepM/ murein hydrolase activator NlpD